MIPDAIIDDDNNNDDNDSNLVNNVNVNYIKANINNNEDENIVQTAMDFSSNDKEENIIKNEEFKGLKLYPVGQVHGTYIIAENEDGMFILDQHAAHERINYEMIKKRFQDDKPTYTDMLIPFSIERVILQHLWKINKF